MFTEGMCIQALQPDGCYSHLSIKIMSRIEYGVEYRETVTRYTVTTRQNLAIGWKFE